MWCMCVGSCVPLVVAFIVSTSGRWSGFRGCPHFRGLFAPLVVCSLLHRGIFPAGTWRKVAKVRFYLLALVFSRGFWRQQTAKT